MRVVTRQYMIGTATELLQDKDSELATVAVGKGKDWEWVIAWDDSHCEGICTDCGEWSEFMTLAVNVTYAVDETTGEDGDMICLGCKGLHTYVSEWDHESWMADMRNNY